MIPTWLWGLGSALVPIAWSVAMHFVFAAADRRVRERAARPPTDYAI